MAVVAVVVVVVVDGYYKKLELQTSRVTVATMQFHQVK